MSVDHRCDITKIGDVRTHQNFDNVVFPLTNGRRFQPNWITKFSWIEYSLQRDAVFCYYCRQFSLSPKCNNPDKTFTDIGYRNWKTALESEKGFTKHEKTANHISAVASMHEKVLRDEQNKEISQLLSDNVLATRRYYVSSIVDVVIFLASNELAFRGNWDIAMKSEDGLFQSLFEYTLEKDEKLRQAVKIIPKNATYTSPNIQNDLITSAVSCM